MMWRNGVDFMGLGLREINFVLWGIIGIMIGLQDIRLIFHREYKCLI